MTIRQLKSADLSAFMEMRTEGLNDDPDCFRVTPADDQLAGTNYWADRLARDIVVGFERGDDLLGIGGLQRMTGEKLAHKALVWGMYIRPSARGLGVADAVLEALVARAPDGVRQLQLTVMAHNQRARTFYERHSFRLYAIEPASVRIGDQFLDEALMWRQLD